MFWLKDKQCQVMKKKHNGESDGGKRIKQNHFKFKCNQDILTVPEVALLMQKIRYQFLESR